MCREGVDLMTIKISLKHTADRLIKEEEHLRHWAALTANINLESVAEKLRQSHHGIEGIVGKIQSAIDELVELQTHGHLHHHSEGGGVTITPV